jgi:hypothetical protein
MASLPAATASPAPFLEVRVRDLDTPPTVRGLCVGYEGGKWRTTDFARHIIEWLPEFALDLSERQGLDAGNAVRLIGKAAATVYSSDRYQHRGEFGEILLHIALRQEFGSMPAISKIYFKSSANETVKGFDAVHVVGPPGELELWLGEAKFYSDVATAARDAVAALHKHSERDYLREEFIWIANKLDASHPHAREIEQLLDRNKSLDTVFRRLCFPVLLTYDSDCVAAHTSVDSTYVTAFETEVRKHAAAFVARGLPPQLRIHVLLIPLHSKEALVVELDRRLKQCQDM